jgi:photosystem II stability/assembly factor-like uncharacterized protein
MSALRPISLPTMLSCVLVGVSVTNSLPPAVAQDTQPPTDGPVEQLFETMAYRSIGPFRGGRAAGVCGDPKRPLTFFMGACGGGVWRTDDGGTSWRNISDGYFGGSIGAVALSPSDANVIYVGGGEGTVRGNVSHGGGIWKSVDGGESWTHKGLSDTRHVPGIHVHPQNSDLVYVAALGHLYGPNEQRGVFRSRDGGDTWQHILSATDEAGAVDLVLDPNNPRIIYASTWKIRRTPFSLESGGEGSGLWKSTDGGDSWTNITRRTGLPQGTVGIIGMAVSPVDSKRVWAQIEAEDGGLFRSDDAGRTWSRVNQDRSLRQRAWYYSRVHAGTTNRDEVYVLNVGFHRSRDGGKTFSRISTPHSDHHDLWIDPVDANRLVVADDGGAQISYNAGATWSAYDNQPTAQFYRVTTDNHFPYRIYGAQQDNSTVRIASRSMSFAIREDDWESTAGGESGHIAPDPDDPEIVYGGSYGGDLSRFDHRTRQNRSIDVWPDNPIGRGAVDLKYRFQWNFPILFSPHDPDTLYTAANVLFKSTDEGHSWSAISPDLTRNDPTRLGPSGGPITKDNTGVEVYCTIFAVAESTHEPGVIWAGSDDGLVHLTTDGGDNWNNVTPVELPEWSMINSIEVDPFEKGGVYLAATRYKLDDFRPLLYHSVDYGKTWKLITSGIDPRHFTRVVRADPNRKGLLYAGTENGIYVSLDNGLQWQSFQLNLPIVPITDLAIKDDDLIVATQGRSFWVLDDLTQLHQFQPDIATTPTKLFQTRPVYRLRGSSFSQKRSNSSSGVNPVGGVVVRYWLRDKPAEDVVVQLEILDADGKAIQTFSTQPDLKEGGTELKVEAGYNSVHWDLRYAKAESFDGLILWGGGTQGPRARPGHYAVRLTVGEQEYANEFEILHDPRLDVSDEDYQLQFQFLVGVRDKLTEIHKAIRQIRDVRTQIKAIGKRLESDDKNQPIVDSGNQIIKAITAIEETLYQTQSKSAQDPLNFPIRLNNRLSYLATVAGSADARPTTQIIQLRDELTVEIDRQLSELSRILNQDLKKHNQRIRRASVPAVFTDE